MSNPWITSTKASAYKSNRASGSRCNLPHYLHELGWHQACLAGGQNLEETVSQLIATLEHKASLG